MKFHQTKTNIFRYISLFACLSFLTKVTLCQISVPVIINEINYRSINAGENIDFVELYNTTSTNINLSGWTLTDGIGYVFPNGTTIAGGGYLVIAADPGACSNAFGINDDIIGPYSGSLSGSGDEVKLRDLSYSTVDKVEYDSWKEWPSVRFINGGVTPISIQKIHPDLTGNYAGSWDGAIPTPNSSNNEVLISTPNDIPIIKNVSKSPNAPVSNQAVKIKVKVANYAKVSVGYTVDLQYQIVDPGNYIAKNEAVYFTNWTTIEMFDNGLNTDSLANDGVFTATIPSNVQLHRRLVRYRIVVSTNNDFTKMYPDQKHNENNYAYFVYNGQSSFNGYSINQLDYLQEIHLISKASDVFDYIDGTGYSGIEYPGKGTLVYRGKVYDHIGFRARGKDSRHFRLKKNMKFDLNNENPIKVYNDYDKAYDVERSKLSLSGTWVADGNSHGLTESLIYKIAELTGSVNKSTDYCQFRIIDDSNEDGNNGDFRGVYLITEDFNADLIEERGLPDGNIYSYKPFDLAHQGEMGPFGINNSTYINWNSALGNSQDGCTNCAVPTQSKSFYKDNLALDLFYNDWVMNEICGNSETNYPGQHSYVEYYNPVTQKWLIRGADYDNMFGMPEDEKVVYYKTQSKDYRKVRVPLKDQLLTYNDFKKEIANKLRSTLDLLLNAEQLDYLLSSESSKIYNPGKATNWTDLDKSRWVGQLDGHAYEMNYNNYKNDVIEWYRNWFNNRKDHLLNDATSYQDWDVDQNFFENPVPNVFENEEGKVPEKPVIGYAGPAGYPLDQLTFDNSAFVDNTGSFAALQWRVGEWSDPANPIYNSSDEPKYEIETKWISHEISSFSNQFQIPAEAQLKVGRTYKVRVRYKDSTKRWSHWSEPVTLVPSAAAPNPTYTITINEIMYHPSDNCGVEFIELYNFGISTIDLDNFKFVEGIDYDFPAGSTLDANSYLVLAKDSLEFIYKYGFSPFGDYSGGLSNSLDTLILTGPYRTIVDELTYTDKTPWVKEPDGDGPSLSLIQPDLDNAQAENWYFSFDDCGTPGAYNDLCKPMSVGSSVANVTCNGASDGFIAVSVTGGTTPYSYDWNNGFNSSFANQLAYGNYSVTITDALLCSITKNFSVSEPPSLVLNTSVTDETTYSGADGTASVSVSGGTPPYAYSWSNGATTNSINGLIAGSYTVTVRDKNFCSESKTVTVSGIVCNDLTVSIQQKNVDCYGDNNGRLIINNMQNGNAPYKILWSTGITGTVTNNLSAGNYTLNITDNLNCSFAGSYLITQPAAPLSATTTIKGTSNNNTNDGAIDLTVQGGTPPYNYYWSNGARSEDISNLIRASYWANITDSNGCNIVINNITVGISTCQPVLSLLDNSVLPSGTHQGSNLIESNCIISNSSQVTFQAGNLIDLQNDFEVKAGATFEAKIESCD